MRATINVSWRKSRAGLLTPPLQGEGLPLLDHLECICCLLSQNVLHCCCCSVFWRVQSHSSLREVGKNCCYPWFMEACWSYKEIAWFWQSHPIWPTLNRVRKWISVSWVPGTLLMPRQSFLFNVNFFFLLQQTCTPGTQLAQDWVFVCKFLTTIVLLYIVSPALQSCFALELLVKKDYKAMGNELISCCKWVIFTACS